MDRYTSRFSYLLMIVALACAMSACAGRKDVAPIDVERQAFDDLRTEIREIIDDPAREAQAISLTDELIADFYRLREKVSERRRRLRDLNRNYDATREEFEAFFDEVEADIQANRKQVIETERALLAAMTPEERALLGKAQTKAMKVAIRTIQSI